MSDETSPTELSFIRVATVAPVIPPSLPGGYDPPQVTATTDGRARRLHLEACWAELVLLADSVPDVPSSSAVKFYGVDPEALLRVVGRFKRVDELLVHRSHPLISITLVPSIKVTNSVQACIVRYHSEGGIEAIASILVVLHSLGFGWLHTRGITGNAEKLVDLYSELEKIVCETFPPLVHQARYALIARQEPVAAALACSAPLDVAPRPLGAEVGQFRREQLQKWLCPDVHPVTYALLYDLTSAFAAHWTTLGTPLLVIPELAPAIRALICSRSEHSQARATIPAPTEVPSASERECTAESPV